MIPVLPLIAIRVSLKDQLVPMSAPLLMSYEQRVVGSQKFNRVTSLNL